MILKQATSRRYHKGVASHLFCHLIFYLINIWLFIISSLCRVVIKRRGRGFPPATKKVVHGYFHWKIEEK